MLACIMYGFSSVTSGILPKILLLIGVLLFFLFLRRELHTPEPLIDLDLFRKNTIFSFSNIAALLNYGASYAVSYLLSIYLQTVLGFDSQIAGLILITSPRLSDDTLSGSRQTFRPLFSVRPHILRNGHISGRYFRLRLYP